MITKKLPALFCSKNTVLYLKKDIEIRTEETEKTGKTRHVPQGTIFKVHDIIGYGFDLVSLDENKYEVRCINSDMPEHFDRVALTNAGKTMQNGKAPNWGCVKSPKKSKKSL